MTDNILQRGAIHVATNTLTCPSTAEKTHKYKCPECDELVVFAKGQILPPYFRHAAQITSTCSHYTKESSEHLEAKQIIKNWLDNRLTTICIERKCNICNEIFCCVVEPIAKESRVIIEHKFVHNNSNRFADIAVISPNNEIDTIIEICHTNPTACEKRPEPWFELNAREVIECHKSLLTRDSGDTVNLKCIRDEFVEGEVYYSTCGECNESQICSDVAKGLIYFNQRGAGCGKTYESIQLLKLNEYLQKHTFIYLTKMKSATCVIYNELMSQIQNGKLGEHVEIIERVEDKQRRVILNIAGVQRTIIIGTIDSFTNAIRDKNRQYSGGNMFEKIVRDIGEGIMAANIDKTAIQYAKLKLSLTNKYMFVIDEAQDLENAYLEAFLRVIDKTGIDAYIIGDKLQSISKEHNLFTYVEGIEDSRVIKNSTQTANVVKRFHNTQFISFVNKIVPFSKYSLPEITGICDGKCHYSHESKNEPLPPVHIEWNFPNIYSFEKPEIDVQFQKIATTMRTLVTHSGYLPCHFCFIFPIVNDKNQLLSALEPFIQHFWVDVFSDPNVYTALLLENMRKNDEDPKSDYWRMKREMRENDAAYYKYIYWHRSEGNQPIDLTESEHSSRILSIHSSKGTGCECVFFLGISQQSLSCFTRGMPDTLVYDSLLHVGLTRQKKYIYVGIDKYETQSKKDIFRRFQQIDTIQDLSDVEPDITRASRYLNLSKITDEILLGESNDGTMLKMIDADNAYVNYSSVTDKHRESISIDWGHHVIRCAVLRVSTHKYLISKINQTGQQLFAMHCGLTQNTDLTYVQYREYNELRYKLKETISKNSGPVKKKQRLTVPILIFLPTSRGGTNDYDAFRATIQSYCNSVIEKLKRKDMCFCPLESIVYCHLMDMTNRPFELSVSMMQIYNILHYYRDFYNNSEFNPIQHKEMYNCSCHLHLGSSRNTLLPPQSKLRNGIVNHYLALDKIDNIMLEYDKQVNIFVNNKHVDYKINPRVVIGDEVVLCDSSLRWTGESDDGNYNISVVTCPQLTSLNIHSIIMNMFLNQCIRSISNGESRPKIIYAIIHLDSDKPLFVDFENIISDEDKLMSVKLELKRILQLYYKPTHSIICDFFEYHRNRDRPLDVSELMHVYKMINHDPKNANASGMTDKYKNIPRYIVNWFKARDEELKMSDKTRKKQIRNGMQDPQWIIDSLHDSLDYVIHTMLKMPFDEDD
jgi:hypothetical protein